tara:strand:+ start:4993 stop:5886 length:894 start_codon:yes stop_codon:yes gene_type:complete
MKNNYTYVLKSIKKDKTLNPILNNLEGKNYIVAGGTRGIGFNIAEKLALNKAKVTILGKTKVEHPKLENTIFTAAEKILKKTKQNNVMPVSCDIREKGDIDNAIQRSKSIWGKIDGVVLNASALCLNNTLNQTKKEVDLMNSVNINGTYLFGQKCLQNMKDNGGHMIIIAPPISMLYNDDWWTNHFYYSMSKFNMSLMARYWNKEFKNVSVNTLWPRTTVATAPVKNLLGGEEMMKISRKPDIMGDAALKIFYTDPKKCNGKNYIDDEVLASLDIDVEKYRVDPSIHEKDLMPDFFC